MECGGGAGVIRLEPHGVKVLVIVLNINKHHPNFNSYLVSPVGFSDHTVVMGGKVHFLKETRDCCTVCQVRNEG